MFIVCPSDMMWWEWHFISTKAIINLKNEKAFLGQTQIEGHSTKYPTSMLQNSQSR